MHHEYPGIVEIQHHKVQHNTRFLPPTLKHLARLGLQYFYTPTAQRRAAPTATSRYNYRKVKQQTHSKEKSSS